MTKFILTLTALSLMFVLTSCAEFKSVGRKIGHTTKDVTTEIGHASRDIATDISEEVTSE